jgi:restriction system protein
MGYTEVEVTKPTNDKGVDVVGNIQLGISEVREAIQVKRQTRNIRRDILDLLRASLHRYRAVRGTVITLGGFAKGTKDAAFETGVAPITLIDGDRLLDLLIEHGIGVKKQQIEYIEFDPSRLTSFEVIENQE